jgi:hypothetical protein
VVFFEVDFEAVLAVPFFSAVLPAFAAFIATLCIEELVLVDEVFLEVVFLFVVFFF